MAFLFRPQLANWFDDGITSGHFKVPNGRHIILNEYARLMKASRLRASAGVDLEALRDFLLAINPNVVTVSDGSPTGIRRQLAVERDRLPALRRVYVSIGPSRRHEHWFVYTPPLEVMRHSWRDVRNQLGLPST